MSDGTSIPAAAALPPRSRSLSSNVRWTLLGTLSSAAGSWLVIVILARAGGPAAVGAYAAALALTAPAMLFAGLQLRNLLASDPQRRYRFRDYLRLTVLTTAAGVLASAVAAAALGGGGAGWSVILPVLAMRASDAFTEIHWGLWQRQERMRVIGVGRVLHLAASAVLVTTASALGWGAPGAAAGTALASLVMLAYARAATARDPELGRAAGEGTAGGRWRPLVRLAAEGFPLGVILLLASLQSSIPWLFVERYAGAGALGLFAAASQLTGSGQVMVVALGSAALPQLASSYAAGDGSFRALARRLALAGLGLGAAGTALSALLGRPILSLVYGAPFGEAAGLLVVLSVAAGLGFAASFLGYALTAARIIRVQPLVLALALAVLLGGCAALVQRAGASGAAWALAASTAVHAGASALVLVRARPPRARGAGPGTGRVP